MAPRRLTLYTALVGAKEPLNNPLSRLPAAAQTDLQLDCVCFTDDRTLRSEVWRFEYLPDSHLPPEKLSRRPKALPHEYLPDVEHSLYIDNTVTLRRLPQSSDLRTPEPYLLRAFRHPVRSRLQEEADVVALLGYDEISTICAQLDFYASRTPLASITPLTAGTVLLRSHHHAAVRRFGVLWWENLLAFSKRDQLAIDFARQQSGAHFDYLPGSLDDNEYVQRDDSAGTLRVRANFDATRYAWRHRDDPQARRDPKAHFLASGGHDGAAFQRRLPLLEYICHQQHSSLGAQVSPRRCMADALESLLAPHKSSLVARSCRYLLVRVQGGAVPQGFAADELAAAALAISLYMGRYAAGTSFDLSAEDLAASDKVYAAQQQPFDLLIVLGLRGEQLAAASQKLARLLAPGRGALVAAMTAPATLQQVLRAEQLLGDVLGAPMHTVVHASRHDDVEGLLDNTVIGWACRPAT